MKISETYECEVCGAIYHNIDAALKCEKTPILQDKGAKIGDKVKILYGDGKGELATVESLTVFEPGWGPAQYNHTRGVCAKLDNSWGSRQLTFTDYELSK